MKSERAKGLRRREGGREGCVCGGEREREGFFYRRRQTIKWASGPKTWCLVLAAKERERERERERDRGGVRGRETEKEEEDAEFVFYRPLLKGGTRRSPWSMVPNARGRTVCC